MSNKVLYEWECVTDKASFAPRDGSGALVFKDKRWLLGGWNPLDKVKFPMICDNDVWSSTDGNDWSLEKTNTFVDKHFNPALDWEGRHCAGYVVFHGMIWILGGGTYDTPGNAVRKYYNDVWSSSGGVSWHCHTKSAPWAPRAYHDVAAFDGKMWVLEGCHPDNSNDVWYSEDGINWHELPDTPWKPRHAAGVFVYSDSLWMVAGNNMESDVWKLKRN